MTNEEAIDVIVCLAWHRRPSEEDIEQAIKALEQQPCDDYVDKKELLKNIEVALDATDINDEYSIGLRNGMRLVKSFVDGKRPDYEKVSHLKKQQPCDDAISRQAAEALFRNARKELMKQDRKEHIKDFNTRDLMLLNAEQFIHLLPSVTPQPKIGHWIEDAKTYYEELNKRGLGVDEYTPYFVDDIACSECLAKYSVIDNETQFFKHCPNCGAKMEVEE